MAQRILVVSFRYLRSYYFFFPKKTRSLKILNEITGFSIQIVGAKKTGAPKNFVDQAFGTVKLDWFAKLIILFLYLR